MKKISTILTQFAQGLECLPVFKKRLLEPEQFSFQIARSLYQFARTDAGSKVRSILDVGANAGQFASMARFAWAEARIMSFEPDEEAIAAFHKTHREDSAITLHTCALGDETKTAQLNRYEQSYNNSILEDVQSSAVGVSTVNVARLDDLLSDDLRDDLFLKLDVQGYELNVLKGAVNTLKRTSWVLLEVSLKPLYQGAPDMDEVWSFMKNQGFQYYDVFDIYRSEHQVITQMDVLFKQNDES